jgi:iron(III) transport system ATP-binding protein
MSARADTKPAALALMDVRKDFGGLEVLKGITLEVEAGEIVCLLGQSGCGKTTLLRIAAGLERPTAGRVALAGWEVAGPDRFMPPERRGIGLMFQDYALFPHLTILGNTMFGLDALPVLRARDIAIAALERVGLRSYAGDYPHMLSGGEQQRAALARALAPGPRILLMDEPFSNLDQRLRVQVREDTVALLREKQTTTVVVTHDPIEAMSFADRIVLMRSGRIVQAGSPKVIYDGPRTLFAARFFCELNEIPGVVREGAAECRLGRFPAPGVPEGDAVVCVRPQAIEVRHLGRGETAGGARGEILRCRFLGEIQRLLIGLEGLDQPLNASLPVGVGSYQPGDKVELQIDHTRVLTFAREAEEQ